MKSDDIAVLVATFEHDPLKETLRGWQEQRDTRLGLNTRPQLRRKSCLFLSRN